MTTPPIVEQDPLDQLKAMKAQSSPKTPGMVTPGNVDLTNRPRVKNPDGSVSTVRSMSIGEDGREILIPTVSDDGRIMSDNEAVNTYHKTGKHLGMFSDVASANRYAQQLHEQQAATLGAPSSDPLEQLKALRGTDPNQKLHDEYKSGRLAGRMGRENANDADEAATPTPGYGERLATHVLNAGQGIPGVRAVEAAAGSLGSKLTKQPMDYRQSLATLDGATGNIGGKTSFLEKAMGGMATAPFLPGGAGASGATLGAADAALSADPESIGERARNTALGAAGGYIGGKVVGRVMQGGTTALRAALATNPADNVLARQAARALSAKQLFSGALTEGHANGPTQAVRDFLAEPDIAARVEALQGLEQFKNTPAESPTMLDALYKSMSDEAKGIKKGLAVADPSKPNTGRFREGNISALKSKLLGAVETPGTKTDVIPPMETAQSPAPSLRDAIQNFHTVKGVAAKRTEGTVEQQMARRALERHGAENIVSPPLNGMPTGGTITTPTPPTMPSYRTAVDDFAKQSGDIDALGKGMTALQASTKPTRPTFKQITAKEPKTPQSFAEWAKTATPSQKQAATEGILGDVKNSFLEPSRTLAPGRRATAQAPELLRSLGTNRLADILQSLGITSANAPFTDK